jgi:hypothetical protein
MGSEVEQLVVGISLLFLVTFFLVWVSTRNLDD